MTAIVWLEVRKALVTPFRDTIILKIALARLLNKLLREKGKIEKERERASKKPTWKEQEK
jgi:hypothetical protein